MTVTIGPKGNENPTAMATALAAAKVVPAAVNEAPKVAAPAPTPIPAAPVAAPTRTNPQPQGNNQMSQITNLITSRQILGVSRAATSQAMRNVMETIDKISEGTDATSPIKYTYIQLDGEKEGMKISAIVVVAALRNPKAEEKFAAHHTLLLDTTNTADRKREAATGKGGLRYERVIVSGEAYDKKMAARVLQVVNQAFPGYKTIDADSSVVPTAVDLRSDVLVRNIVANATSAAATLLTNVTSNSAWMITPEVTNNFNFKNEVKSSFDHFTDLAGNPVRSDVVLEMSYAEKQNNNGNDAEKEFEFNNENPRELVTQMTAYIDIASVPPQQQPQQSFGMQQGFNANAYKIDAARLVITNIDTPAAPGQLSVIMQALGTIQILQNDLMWKNVLLKQYKDGAANPLAGINIRDLSAISLEAPVQVPPMGFPNGEAPAPVRLPLNSAAINEAAALGFISTYFIDQLFVSLDVEESGVSSWMLAPFVAAARGDVNAREDIFAAGDLLTGGRFSTHYKALNGGAMPSPVFNDKMYVDLGDYQTERGLRDSRDVDHLLVLNATGDSELDTINDWANLQANSEVDPLFRLDQTRQIKQKILRHVTVKSRAVRVTLHPSLIPAIAMAVAEAGLTYNTDMSIAAPQSTARMVSPYMRNLSNMGNVGNAGSFAQGGVNRATPGGVQSGSFGRYAHQAAQQPKTGSNF